MIAASRPRARSLPMTLGALAALAVLAGCGGGTKTVTVDRPPAVAAGSAANKKKANKKPASTPKAIVHVSAFQTPSGNIGCMILEGVARCDIEKRSWSPPPRPSSCSKIVDYGQGLEIGASGGARVVCAGDTVREPKAPKLAYGDATQIGAFQCLSEETGLTCERAHQHGFFLSIQSYRVF